jgi:hypothetical protein
MIDIPNYEGLYAVTLDGEIYSHRTGKMKKPVRHKQGYRSVTLVAQDGKISGYLIHRLVATVLIPNKYNKPLVNHKDSNKTNNHPDNLEWCTHQENMDHAKSAGKFRGNGGKFGIENGNYKHGKRMKEIK